MGIEGLLRNLKQVVKVKHLREYKGQTVGIDTYVWLHKIIKSTCLNEIVQGRLTDRFVKECLARIQTIYSFGVKVIMVFDGGRLPSKSDEEQLRKQRRDECYSKADDLISKGLAELAKRKIAEAFDITPDVAHRLIIALKEKKIPFVVAPYEADAQLAYLNRNGYIDVVITEDSDLLPFGAKCVLYKLDYSSFKGEEICMETLNRNTDPNLSSFSHNMFVSACVLTGCDYLNQVKSIGIKGAFQLIAVHKTGLKAIKYLRSRVKEVPFDYEKEFVRAFLTFKLQVVYCPLLKKCVRLANLIPKNYGPKIKESELGNKVDQKQQIIDSDMFDYLIKQNENTWQFAGEMYDDDLARMIAEGDINPTTLRFYEGKQLVKQKYPNPWKYRLPCQEKESEESAKPLNNSTQNDQLLREQQRSKKVIGRYQGCFRQIKREKIYLEEVIEQPLQPTKSKKTLLLMESASATKRKEMVEDRVVIPKELAKLNEGDNDGTAEKQISRVKT